MVVFVMLASVVAVQRRTLPLDTQHEAVLWHAQPTTLHAFERGTCSCYSFLLLITTLMQHDEARFAALKNV